MTDLLTRSSAVFSPCERYRYLLRREWGGPPTCTFIMLNPSTADQWQDDPTIRRCIGFAKREGCGALTVLNIFAFRATDPKVMAAADDPIGPQNDDYLRAALGQGPVVAAWGAHKMAEERGRDVAKMLGRDLLCLGTTKVGAPRHPLYVKRDAPLVPLEVREER